jgi:hypothetical protein
MGIQQYNEQKNFHRVQEQQKLKPHVNAYEDIVIFLGGGGGIKELFDSSVSPSSFFS